MNFLGIIVSYLYIALVIVGAKIFEKRGKECIKICYPENYPEAYDIS